MREYLILKHTAVVLDELLQGLGRSIQFRVLLLSITALHTFSFFVPQKQWSCRTDHEHLDARPESGPAAH